ncbi:hypothetical protein B0H10DRAFT_2239836 [Mycena sp. CBHHK59/15]|nr:hypothetical protein B0H10DRAFT_2239836 [Mycena sp. CBHHK59/15]
MSAPLTSAQKAALTRAANKLAQEQKDQELLKSVPVPRAAKISALNDHVWVSRKREAPEASVSDKKKKPKTTKAIADKPKATKTKKPQANRHLPPDIDDDGDDIPHSHPPQKTAAVPEPPTKPAKLSSRASGAQTPGERSRTLHAPVALSKPAAQSVKDDGSESESGSQNEEGDDDVEEEEEDDEVVDPQQLVAEAPSWVADDDVVEGDVDVDNLDDVEMPFDPSMENEVHDSSAGHSRSGSISSGYGIHVPTSGSEQGSDDDLDYETRMQIARAAGGYGDKLVEQKVVDAEPMDPDGAQGRRPTLVTVLTESSDEFEEVVVRRRKKPKVAPSVDPQVNPPQQPGPADLPLPLVLKKPENNSGRLPNAPPVNISKAQKTVRPQLPVLKSAKPIVKEAAQSTQLSKRKLKAIEERPVWADAVPDPCPMAVPGKQAVSRRLKVEAATPSASFPGTPPLKTFVKVTGDALFINAFPDVGDRLKYCRTALLSISKEIGYSEIRQRLKADETYSKEMARVADARWSSVRGNFKRSANSATIHAFGIKAGGNEKVQTLLASLHTDYIYPLKSGSKDEIDYNKPFGNSAIIETIHDCIFSGRNQLGIKYQSRFPLTDGSNPERMVSPVIASLAATAVCAVLQDCQGPQRVSNDFNANLFAETYEGHMAFLENLQSKSPVAYQNVLTRLYREASGQGKGKAPQAAASNGLAHLNFADMEADSD